MNAIEIEKRIMEEGLKKGIAEGMAQGIAQGMINGRAEEIIESGYEFDLTEDAILERLQNKLNLSLEEAKTYMTKSGKKQNI